MRDDGAGERREEVRIIAAARRDPGQRHFLALEVEPLREADAHALDAVGLQEPRCNARGIWLASLMRSLPLNWFSVYSVAKFVFCSAESNTGSWFWLRVGMYT